MCCVINFRSTHFRGTSDSGPNLEYRILSYVTEEPGLSAECATHAGATNIFLFPTYIAIDTCCPLCRVDASLGHMFGSCKQPGMSKQEVARHDKAIRTVT